jgi:hypothetical protein
VLSSNGKYYWKRSWDGNNESLLKEGKIPKAVPYGAFWGLRVLPEQRIAIP